MLSTTSGLFEETLFDNLPTAPAWPGSTPEQLAFMRRVYAAHVARAARRGRYVGDVPGSELASVEPNERPRMRTAAAADCRAMLAAARADLANEQAAGSAAAKGVRWIGIASGYRSASEQFALWQKYFPRFYRETESSRAAAPGGPHGTQAAALTAQHVGKWIAAPGYSLHNDGRAADLKTSERGLALGPSSSHRKPWRQTWFWAWLFARAANFHFFQNTRIDEPWHWEHRPERPARESDAAAVPARRNVIPAGLKVVDSVPGLATHRGSGPLLVLRWNDLTRTDKIDVAIHFHGFACQGGAMHLVSDKLPLSGLDWRDPDCIRTGQRARPTLFILPRGHYDPRKGGLQCNRKILKDNAARYTFPALNSKPAMEALCSFALEQLKVHLGLTRKPGIDRLILTAHSGGGAAVECVLANGYDPDEVHLYDAMYGAMNSLAKWATSHIKADANPASGAKPGALRVLYLPGSMTAGPGNQLHTDIRTALRRLPNGTNLAKRYRVEEAKGSHYPMPRRYGWQLFANPAADVI